MLLAVAAHAETWTANNVTYTYTVVNGEASLYNNGDVAISTSESVVEIPSTLGEERYPVTRIGERAFYNRKSLTCVTIPNGVTSIDYRTFCGCSGLTSVTIPDGVTRIGGGAFYSCTGLARVTMQGNAPSVGDWAFDDIGEGAVVRLPRAASGYKAKDGKWQGMAVEWYGPTFTIDENGVLTGVQLYEVTDLSIPDGVTGIADYAFLECGSLARVTIPASVTRIGHTAFLSCGALTDVTMLGDAPNGGDWAFDYIGEGAVVHLPRAASGYKTENGKWQGMAVEWHGSAPGAEIAVNGEAVAFEDAGDGRRGRPRCPRGRRRRTSP